MAKKINRKGKSLFIINSPFQCLCMFEAIEHYSIVDFDVILRPDSVEKNNEMLGRILLEKGIEYRTVKMNHIIKDTLPYLFKRKVRYDHFFIGDYYSGGVIAYIYALMYARKKAQITYLDDGTVTLCVFSDPPTPRYKNYKIALLVKLFEILKIIKGVGKPDFFTIFNIESSKYKIERNLLKKIKQKVGNLPPHDIYIIGTNFYQKEELFLTTISKLIYRIREMYKNQRIYYCPHRRNTNNEKLFKLLSEEGVEIFNTKVSVEYDFAENGINPLSIIGFGSTALFTLKMIFPNTSVMDVLFHSFDDGYQQEFKRLSKELGITSMSL